MSQIDWVGETEQRKFKDIRNTRPSNAEEKARLCMELGSLLKRIPQSAVNGSVQDVRRWKLAVDECTKTVMNKRSTSVELGIAIKRMHAFFE